MTEQEAIEELVDMANALQLIPNTPKGKAVSMALKALKQEPCEDAISREEVIHCLEQLVTDIPQLKLYAQKVADAISDLPYVYQEPKTGHWIIEVWNNKEHHTCSNCQHVVTYEPCYHYCPYCGAKMVEPQESEKV